MKVTVPHMGCLYIALEALLDEMGHEVVIPPPCTKRTLDLGTKHSPESACLPLKLNVGNFLEAVDLGAEAIIMGGGSGPCRFGYYAQVQREILRDLGLDVEVVVLEPPRENFAKLVSQLRRLFGVRGVRGFASGLQLAWSKVQGVETLERAAHWARPRERHPGQVSQELGSSLAALRTVTTVRQTEQTVKRQQESIRSLGVQKEEPIKVGIVGEIYTVVEPFANLQLEERLGHLGVEVHRTVNVAHWVRDHLVLNALRLYRDDHLRTKASGYLRGFVGGHGLESVAHTVMLSEQDYAGVVHILPFTCMPEIVAQSVLGQVSEDHQLPILTLVVDEHTGETGFQTRIEAFVDLLVRRAKGVSYGTREVSVSRH